MGVLYEKRIEQTMLWLLELLILASFILNIIDPIPTQSKGFGLDMFIHRDYCYFRQRVYNSNIKVVAKPVYQLKVNRSQNEQQKQKK